MKHDGPAGKQYWNLPPSCPTSISQVVRVGLLASLQGLIPENVTEMGVEGVPPSTNSVNSGAAFDYRPSLVAFVSVDLYDYGVLS